jgi:4-diphosphocytidyl-2C-methyl-D-erythritol kinase
MELKIIAGELESDVPFFIEEKTILRNRKRGNIRANFSFS